MAIDNASFQNGRPGAGDQTAAQSPVVLPAQSGEAVLVPEGFPLVSAAFERQGSDLLLVAKDGSRVLIEDYFALAQPPALTTVGGALLPADLVEILAGPMAPGQYAQLGPGATAVPIGTVATIEGSVMARVDGTVVPLALDVDVFQGDVLETEAGATVGLVFNDDTTFALGENGRMVLDKLIFDPDSGEGESLFSVLEGTFVFVSGQIAANNPDEMLVRTPVATIGVRGTTVGGKAAPEGQTNTYFLMPDPVDGEVGSFTLSNAVTEETGPLVVNNIKEPWELDSFSDGPEKGVWNANAMNELFGGLFGIVAQVAGQEPGGGDEIIGGFGERDLAGGTYGDVLGAPNFGNLFAGLLDVEIPPLEPLGLIEPEDHDEEEDDRITVNLTAGNDFFDGNLKGFFGSKLKIFGLDGNDVIFGSFNGGGTSVGDIVDGAPGNDLLVGSHFEGEDFENAVQDDTLIGGPGDDDLNGLDGNDVLDGGPGEDDLFGGDGSDGLSGGDGADDLDGENGNDVLRGGPGNDLLFGGPGDDRLDGGDGNDEVFGEDGNNTILGGTGLGNDTLDGGEAEGENGAGDTLTYASTTEGVIVDLAFNFAQGFDEDSPEIGFDIIFNFEIVIGGSGDDSVFGGDEEETIFGGLGEDTLLGKDGDDSTVGGSGDDLLVGGQGQDKLIGGPGLDIYGYDNLADLPVIAEGQNIVGLVGDFINDADGIGQFVGGAGPGGFLIAPGTPIIGGVGEGSNFTTLGVPFDGTNATSEAFPNEQPSFIFDSDNNLSFDPNGFFDDGEPNAFNVVGFSVFNVEPEDIEIVAALGIG